MSNDPTSVDKTHRLTPEYILERVRLLCPGGEIGLDPCTFPDNPTKALAFFTKEDDGLSRHFWSVYGLTFVNEPYSRTESPLWSAKVVEQANAAAEIVRLTKLCGSGWAHDSVWNAAQAVCILRGRPRHKTPGAEKAEGAGKFDSVVAYYGDRARAFKRAFEDLGRVVLL